MDNKPTDRLGLKGRMMILTALQTTYDRDAAFDIAQKSADMMLKIVAVATADYATAMTLMHERLLGGRALFPPVAAQRPATFRLTASFSNLAKPRICRGFPPVAISAASFRAPKTLT